MVCHHFSEPVSIIHTKRRQLLAAFLISPGDIENGFGTVVTDLITESGSIFQKTLL